MKLFKSKPNHIIRLTISKKDETTQYINLVETTQDEAMKTVSKLIDAEYISLFEQGNRTRIDFRDCTGGKNGLCKSLSFRGLSTQQTAEIILDYLN